MSAAKAHVVKKLLQEIPKGALNTMGAALAASLLSLGSKAIRSALGLSLSDAEVSSIRFWLLIAGIGTFLSVGWFLFFRVRRKLHSVEKQLCLIQSHPRRFRDDYTFDKRLGLYRHKSKPELFCGTCTPQDIESPLKEMPHGWECLIDRKHWHRNPDYQEPPRQKTRFWIKDGW